MKISIFQSGVCTKNFLSEPGTHRKPTSVQFAWNPEPIFLKLGWYPWFRTCRPLNLNFQYEYLICEQKIIKS